MDRERLDDWCEWGIVGLVMAILVFTPLAIGSVRPQEFLVVQWLTVALVAVWGARFYVNPKHRLLWPPVCWAVLAFVAYAVGRYLTADIEFVARQELIRVVVYAVVFYAVLHNLHKQEWTQLVVLTLVSLAMLMSMYAIYQFLADVDYVWTFEKPAGYKKRGSGTFICPNHLAGYLVMVLPLAVACLLTGRFGVMTKVFLGYATLVIVAGITVTFSRGGWMAAGAGALVVFVWLLAQRDYWKQTAILLVVILGMFSMIFVQARLSPNRHERFTVAAQVEDVRFKLWDSAWKIWQAHLWFGAGPAHYEARFPQYRAADSLAQGEEAMRPLRVHNDYLNTLADWGLAGAALVLAVWALFYWQVFRVWKFVQRGQNDLGAKRSNKFSFVLGGAAGLAAILVHSFMDFNMHIPSNALLAVTLMALVSSHYRFSSERYWHTVRLPLRIPVTLVLVGALAFLGLQTARRTQELVRLSEARRKAPNSDAQIAALKRAFAVEPMNFETAQRIGEAYRLQSFQGADGYEDLARQAMQWLDTAIRLNPYSALTRIRYGMCLDWLGRHPEAAEYFAKALALDPNGYSTLAHMGWHHLQREDYDQARGWFEKSLRMNSTSNWIASNYLQLVLERLEKRPSPPGPP
jgi:O-antigen ligase